MKVEVEVLRAEQSWDMKTGVQQNFLVIEVLGLESRVPCTEQELVHVIRSIGFSRPAETYESDDEQETEPSGLDELDESEAVAAPATFQLPNTELEPAPPRPAASPTRRLAPVQRQRGDDVGIAQG